MELVAKELRKWGANVVFERPYAGYVESAAGRLTFLHDGDNTLTVFVAVDLGHFSRSMLLEGIRQTVEESVKRFQCAATS